jgi:hypothetical protein
MRLTKKLVLQFLDDIELGLNVSIVSKKGSRSATRLNTLRGRLTFILSQLQDRGVGDVRGTKKEDLHKLFNDMQTGGIKTRMGTAYKSTRDYIKVFKTFWHWHVRVIDEENEEIDEENKRIEIENSKLSKNKKKPLRDKRYVMDVVKYPAI